MDDWQEFDAPRKIDWIKTFPRPLEECPGSRRAE
jgi:hypothetical protein